MDRFVCVRLVKANALDLQLFRFDYDMTFAVFLMTADKEIYGRFGSRSGSGAASRHFSLEAFRKALVAALDLHAAYPQNRGSLKGKKGSRARFRVPEDFPSLKRYGPDLNYKGKVTNSCIHCHQVAEAEKLLLRRARKPLPDHQLYPWPLPDVLGLSLSPTDKAVASSVREGSSAERDGFRAGDEILSMNGQPILSIADVQWVLHGAGTASAISVVVRRGDTAHDRKLSLPARWRERGDISWRPSTRELRRVVLGGMRLQPLSPEERRSCGLEAGKLALRVHHLGGGPDEAVARIAGFSMGDILVAFDGQDRDMSESDLIVYGLRHCPRSTKVNVSVLRDGKRQRLKLRMQ
jgi:hypothetical protein